MPHKISSYLVYVAAGVLHICLCYDCRLQRHHQCQYPVQGERQSRNTYRLQLSIQVCVCKHSHCFTMRNRVTGKCVLTFKIVIIKKIFCVYTGWRRIPIMFLTAKTIKWPQPFTTWLETMHPQHSFMSVLGCWPCFTALQHSYSTWVTSTYIENLVAGPLWYVCLNSECFSVSLIKCLCSASPFCPFIK